MSSTRVPLAHCLVPYSANIKQFHDENLSDATRARLFVHPHVAGKEFSAILKVESEQRTSRYFLSGDCGRRFYEVKAKAGFSSKSQPYFESAKERDVSRPGRSEFRVGLSWGKKEDIMSIFFFHQEEYEITGECGYAADGPAEFLGYSETLTVEERPLSSHDLWERIFCPAEMQTLGGVREFLRGENQSDPVLWSLVHYAKKKV
jgi:hypothetical protein